jgi:hypothetical protein
MVESETLAEGLQTKGLNVAGLMVHHRRMKSGDTRIRAGGLPGHIRASRKR